MALLWSALNKLAAVGSLARVKVYANKANEYKSVRLEDASRKQISAPWITLLWKIQTWKKLVYVDKAIKLALYREDKWLRHLSMMIAKYLGLNRPWSCKFGRKKKKKKLTCMTFLCMIALRNKTVTHTFLPSFHNANSRLCQERLRTLRSNNGDVHKNVAEK